VASFAFVVVSVSTVPRYDAVAVAVAQLLPQCLASTKSALFARHVSDMEARLLCSLVGEMKFAMSSGEIDFKLGPCIGRYRSRLPCMAGVGIQSYVEHESVCKIDDHGRTVRLAACHCERSCILNLLKKRLDRLIGIIRRVEALLVLREFSRCNHGVESQKVSK
jgi:hypothetical protein